MAETDAATPVPRGRDSRAGEATDEEIGDPAAGASGYRERRGSRPSSLNGEAINNPRAWKACAPPARLWLMVIVRRQSFVAALQVGCEVGGGGVSHLLCAHIPLVTQHGPTCHVDGFFVRLLTWSARTMVAL